MKTKLSKILPAFALAASAFGAFTASNAFATELDPANLNEEGAYTIYAAPPKTMDEKYRLNELINEDMDGWGITSGGVWGCNDAFTSCKFVYHGSDWTDDYYDIDWVYDEDIDDLIDDVLADFEIPEDGFKATDLELLNHWFYGGTLSDYSSEAKAAFKHYNLEAAYITRGGGAHPLVSHNIGTVDISYQGILYKCFGGMPEPKVVAPHIFYVPTGTAEADKADALMARLIEVYGEEIENVVSIEATNTIADSLFGEGDFIEAPYFDGYMDEKVYNLNVSLGELGDSYNIIIVADSSKITEPESLLSIDLLTGVTITSNDATLPGDAKTYAMDFGNLTGDEQVATEIADAIGQSVFNVYELGLYSNALEDNVSDGEFTVSTPIPDSLKGKRLSAYWINFETDEPEEHYAAISADGKTATWDTNHFSTYILAESSASRPADEESADETPEAPNSGAFTHSLDGATTALPLSGIIIAGLWLIAKKR